MYAAVCDVTDDVTKNGGINDDVQCTDNADVSSGVICADNDSTLPAVNVGSLQFNDQVNTNNADWELVKRQHPKKKSSTNCCRNRSKFIVKRSDGIKMVTCI